MKRDSKLDRCHNIADLRELSKRNLPRGLFDFVDLGAEDNRAMQANLDAFERVKFKTRFLVDLSRIDIGIDLFGKRAELPLVIAPTGFAGMCWYQGELALARAAAKAGVPFTLCAHSTAHMETVAKIPGGRPWIQVQLWCDLDRTLEMIGRARDLDFEALVITIDGAPGRNREFNKRNGFVVPFKPAIKPIMDMLRRPAWLSSVILRNLFTNGMLRHVNFPDGYRVPVMKGVGDGVTHNIKATWADLQRVRDAWPRKFIVKGVLSSQDAIAAIDCGADAIVVSNHGGRALDSAAATMDVLPEIVEAVAGCCTILIDGGVRRGGDIVKAIALGADAVLVGRPTLWGVSAGGQVGAEKALRIFAKEFEMTMAFIGCTRPQEIDKSSIFTAPT